MKLNKLTDDGYIEVNGSSELGQITSGASKTSFHRVVHPALYDEYKRATNDEDRRDVRIKTPLISRSDYATATVIMFLERVESSGYKATTGDYGGIKIIFYSDNNKSFFSISNTQLMLHLTLFAEALGVPTAGLNLRHLAKDILKDLSFRVRLMDLKKQ